MWATTMAEGPGKGTTTIKPTIVPKCKKGTKDNKQSRNKRKIKNISNSVKANFELPSLSITIW